MIKWLFYLLLFFLTAQCSHPQKPTLSTSTRFSVLQGLTTQNTTQISVVRPRQKKIIYKVQPTAPLSIRVKTFKNSPWVVDHLHIDNLNLSQNYRLSILNSEGRLLEQRHFKPFNTEALQHKIAIASCMDDRYQKIQQEMWPIFISQKADIHFFIGDNVYGDKNVRQPGMATPEELWQRYIDTRLSLKIYHTPHLTPTLALWDDHDYGNNGGGINYPYKKESQKIFKSFFPQNLMNNSLFSSGPGISFLFRFGGQNYYFLDNRSFRTNSKAKIDFHLGAQQEKWLFNQLKQNSGHSWLINGNQFFGGYQRFESFEKNHPNNFKNLMTKIKKHPNTVGFISGDRHLFEVMEIKPPDLKYSTIELTTSAIHAKVYPSSWKESPNPRQLYGVANKYNFAVLTTQSLKSGVQIDLKGIGPKSELLYRLQKTIK